MDNYAINVGKKVNSISGLMDGIINGVFRGTGPQFVTLDNAMAAANTAGYATTETVDAGKAFGSIIKAFFSTEAPQTSLTYGQ